MRLSAGWLAACCLSFLAGCSFSQPAAPVREPRSAKPVTRPPPVMPQFYRVRPGDNLFRIALEHGLEYRLLAAWNGLEDPARIQAGELLRLKPPQAKVAPAPSVPPPPAELPDDPPAQWMWPVRGQVLTRFDGIAGANGLDIGGRRGSPVVAAAPGRIVYVGAGLRGYGKLIIIKHNSVLLSAYGHNERVLVVEGQTVSLGQVIAEMGDSDAERVKLHFEIREYGKPVDPMSYLPG